MLSVRHSGLLTLAALALCGCKVSDYDLNKLLDPIQGTKYSYNDVLSFGRGGTAEAKKISGWHIAEEEFTWTRTAAATVAIQVPATSKPVVLRATAEGLTKPPELTDQAVTVSINDVTVAQWNVASRATFTAAIPANISTRGGTMVITFKTRQPTSPSALQLGADPRNLGVCFRELSLSEGDGERGGGSAP